MSNVLTEAVAVILTVALYLGLLECLRILIGPRRSRYSVIFIVGCIVMLFLGVLPASLSSSEPVLLITYIALGISLATWTVARATRARRHS